MKHAKETELGDFESNGKLSTLNESERQEVLNILVYIDLDKYNLTIESDSVNSQLVLISQNKTNEEDEDFYLISNDLEKLASLKKLLEDMLIKFDTLEC